MFPKEEHVRYRTCGAITPGSPNTSNSVGRLPYKLSSVALIQTDPLGYPDGASRYQLEAWNPGQHADPFGCLNEPSKGQIQDPIKFALPHLYHFMNNLLIAQLGSDDSSVRDKAYEQLKVNVALDPSLLRQLYEQTEFETGEIQSRLFMVLKYSVTPETIDSQIQDLVNKEDALYRQQVNQIFNPELDRQLTDQRRQLRAERLKLLNLRKQIGVKGAPPSDPNQ